MPNCVTHYLHAKKVLEKLDDDIRQNIDSNAYFWAAQGPDFLFCHRYLPFMPGKSLQEYGSKIHKIDPVLLLSSLRDYMNRHLDDNKLHSYVLGFVNHYMLDSTAHPFVNFRAAEMLEKEPDQDLSTMHGEIESSIDTILLRRETGKLPSQVKLQKFFPKDKPVQQDIAGIYRDLIYRIFGDEVSEESLYRATFDTQKVFSLLTDSTTMKRKLFLKLESGKPRHISGHILPFVEDPEMDYVNLSGRPWQNSDGSISTKNFFKLFEEAVEKSVKLISNFNTCDFDAAKLKVSMDGALIS